MTEGLQPLVIPAAAMAWMAGRDYQSEGAATHHTLQATFELTENSYSGFTDVSASNTFHADIGRLATAGITKGCNPPDNTRYCPKDYVTRGQMAAFLHRADKLR